MHRRILRWLIGDIQGRVCGSVQTELSLEVAGLTNVVTASLLASEDVDEVHKNKRLPALEDFRNFLWTEEARILSSQLEELVFIS